MMSVDARTGWTHADAKRLAPVVATDRSSYRIVVLMRRCLLSASQEHFDALASYYADGDKNVDREPVFAPELGLAVEKLREGVTLEDLWGIGS
jgi:hypothetical protein